MHTYKGLELVQLLELGRSVLLVELPLEDLELATQGSVSSDLAIGGRLPDEEGQHSPHLGEDSPSCLDALGWSQASAHLVHHGLDAVDLALGFSRADLVHLVHLQVAQPTLALCECHRPLLGGEALEDLLLDGDGQGLVGPILEPSELDLEAPIEVQQDLGGAT